MKKIVILSLMVLVTVFLFIYNGFACEEEFDTSTSTATITLFMSPEGKVIANSIHDSEIEGFHSKKEFEKALEKAVKEFMNIHNLKSVTIRIMIINR